MEWFVKNYVPKGSKVLDVGASNVNGTYRSLFKDCEYTSLDMDGDADIILENPYDWSTMETDSYDIVISGQMFEHCEFFWLTMIEMTRVLKKDGLMCIIAPNGFHEHRYPVDCYRFFTDGMVAMTRYCNLEPVHAHMNKAPNKKDSEWCVKGKEDALVIARKPYAGITIPIDVSKYKCIPPDHDKLKGDLK